VDRRLFDYFYIELCVAVNIRLPRYELWQEMRARGCLPEQLYRKSLLTFLDEHLAGFLAPRRIALTDRQTRSLRRRMTRFDAGRPTPYELMERISTS
jgi:hypothetical protein